jgi:poly(3-hydroxybutyrate) depolymerase
MRLSHLRFPNRFCSSKTQFKLVLLAAILLSFRVTSLAVEQKDFVNPPSLPDGSAFSLFPYKIYAPPNLDPTKRYPLVVFLHGAGERGTDNALQFKNRAYGALVLAEQPSPNEAFMMMPQTHDAWAIQKRYDQLVNEIDRLNTQSMIWIKQANGTVVQSPNPWKGKIDMDRLYVTGFSLGGEGTFFFLSQSPSASSPSGSRFAAGIPVAATFSKASKDAWPMWAPNIARVPAWVVSSTTDEFASIANIRALISEVRASAGNPISAEINGLQHTQVPPRAYPQQKLINWLFAQRKGTSPQQTPYTVITDPAGTQVYNAGAQKTFTLESVVDPAVMNPDTSVSGINQTADRNKEISSQKGAQGQWYTTLDLIPRDNLITILARANGLFSILNPNYDPTKPETITNPKYSSNSTSFSATRLVRRAAKGWLFDFGSDAFRTSPFWNNVTNPAAGTVPNAINSDGASTSVSLTIEGAFRGIDTSGVIASDVYPSTAQRDSFYVQGWETGMIRIKGLKPSALYNLRFFASASAGDRTTRYRIENVSASRNASQNTSQTAILTKVPATAQGELLVRVVSALNGTGFGHIGVLELTVSDP